MPPWNLGNYPVGSPEYVRIKARINEIAREHRAKHRVEIAARTKQKRRENPELFREKGRAAYARRAEKARATALRRYYETRDDPDRKARARATTEEWKRENPERYKALKDDWYERNKERIRADSKAAYVPHPLPVLTKEEKRRRRLEAGRKFTAANREKIKAKRREQWKDPEFRRKWYEARELRWKEKPETMLKHRLRTRMRHALHGELKAANTMDLVGCSTMELRQHIEALWKDKMDWSNYGSGPGAWQVDHIRPLASFQLSDPEQQRQAFHFSNLSPEWWEANSSKSGKWNGVNYGIQRRERLRELHQLPSCPPAREAAQSPA